MIIETPKTITEITSSQELMKIELGIMKEIHSFCQENNLKYILWAGSLLGAIRHDGFIPWDDDMDICMPRKDYEYFCNHFNSKHYGVYSCKTNPLYPYWHAKAFDKRTIKKEPIRVSNKFKIGIDVDIFPLDKLDDINIFTKKELLFRKNIRNTWENVLTNLFRNKFNKTVKTILYSFYRKPNKYARIVNEKAVSFSKNKNNDLFMVYCDSNAKGPLIIEKNIFEKLQLHKYEDTEFYITSEFDYILTEWYKDYMTPPPIEKRVTHHLFHAYLIEEN